MVSEEAIEALKKEGFQVRMRYHGRPAPVECSALEQIAEAMHEDARGIEQGFERPPKEIRIVRTDTIADDDYVTEDEYLVLWKEDQSGGHHEELWSRTEPTFQSDFLMREHFPEWLGDIRGKTILDACCGEGYVARMLASRGAKVYGFDNNPEMIYLARSMEEKEKFGCGYKSGISYKVADLMDIDKRIGFYSKEYEIFNYPGKFDVAILSGVPPFLTADGLDKTHRKIAERLKPGGILLVTSLHTDAYFQRAESGWMVFPPLPYDEIIEVVLNNPSSPSIKSSLDFYAPNGELAFSSDCYFHTPLRIKSSMEGAGFEVIGEYAPLASEEDIKHFPERWKDEVRVPFHLALLGRKAPNSLEK